MSTLLAEIIDPRPDAKVLVLFGGSPQRRHEILSLVQTIGGITAYGTLSEAQGMARLDSLPRVDLVLIGSRYTDEQRERIRAHVRAQRPGTRITEPGHDYPYEDQAIVAAIRRELSLAR